MSRSKLENTIRGVYASLESLESKHVGRMTSLLHQAYTAALEGERQHRRCSQSAYRESAKLAAVYFACKWTLEETDPPKGWADAAGVRLDALYGHALGEQLRAKAGPELGSLAQELAPIDYSRDIAGNP